MARGGADGDGLADRARARLRRARHRVREVAAAQQLQAADEAPRVGTEASESSVVDGGAPGARAPLAPAGQGSSTSAGSSIVESGDSGFSVTRRRMCVLSAASAPLAWRRL